MELEAYGHSKISIHALREEGDRATTSPRSNHGISIHALREEGDGAAQLPTGAVRDFYPRPPRGGRLKIIMPEEEPHVISIHALREEGDSGMRSGALNRSNFYPRPPRGGRLVSLNIKAAPDLQFLSPPSARRATMTPFGPAEDIEISIPALREVGDPLHTVQRGKSGALLAPPSARRATWIFLGDNRRQKYFYPRPPRGGRQIDREAVVPVLMISIHALREEGDRGRRV